MFISKIFTPSQFDSPDVAGSGVNMQQSFISLLEIYFNTLVFPPIILSGFRTLSYNKSINGALNSAHIRGYAVDLQAATVNQRNEMIKIAVDIGFRRIGIYPTFIHLDNDPSLTSPAYWGSDFTSKTAPFNPFDTEDYAMKGVVATPLIQRSQPPSPLLPKYDYLDVDQDMTAQEFINKYNLTISPDDLVNGNSNAIYLKYNGAERKQYGKASVDLIKGQTKLLVHLADIQRQKLIAANSFVFQNISYNSYLSSYVNQLVSSNLYKRAEKQSDSGTYIQSQKPSVYIWCKAIDQVIDVSAFVLNLQIHTAENGGNFSLSLAPIICDWDKNIGWRISGGNIVSYNNNNDEQDYIAFGNTYNIKNKKQFLTKKYFHIILSSNDLVFIRGERLAAESVVFSAKDSSLQINESRLPGLIYDMIGLIDINPLQSNLSAANDDIVITGRDFSKALIEDNVQYFPNEFAGVGRTGYFKDQQAKNIDLVRRFEGDGSIIPDGLFNAFYARTIAQTITFIISRLANIQICPDSVFNAWKQKTMFNYPLVSGGTKDIQAKGIWQIVSLFVQGSDPNATDNDKLIANRLIADSSISTDSGSLLNFVHKVCQSPWIQFMMDTVGDRFIMTVRRPPFTWVDFKSNFTIDLLPDEIESVNLDFADKEIYSWYRLTPQANYFGDSNFSATAYLKAVMFPEYMEIWGSRAFDVVSNYMTTDSFDQDKDQVKIFDDYFRKQNVQDLEFCMECYAYMPFVRSGTITLKPNRLIKKGMNIYNPLTDELCYVKGVTHNWSISNNQVIAGTTITVERCMVKKYLENYFKIINLNKYLDPSADQSQLWTVNKDLFNFFIKRLQFV